MFSTISRGSSRVRQTYICSACRCNIHGHASLQQSHLPSSGATSAATSSFSTSASQWMADNGEPGTGEPATGDDSTKRPRREKRERDSPMPLSKSQSTLRALRQSLLNEPVPPLPRRKSLAKERTPTKGSAKKTVKLTSSRSADSSHNSETLEVVADPPADVVQEEATIKAESKDTSSISASQKAAKSRKKTRFSKAGEKATPSKVSQDEIDIDAKIGFGTPDKTLGDAETPKSPKDLPVKKKPVKKKRGKSPTKVPAKILKTEKPTSKITLPKVSPKKTKPASNIPAGTETKTSAKKNKSWTVIGEDGREFIIRLRGSPDTTARIKATVKRQRLEEHLKSSPSPENVAFVKETKHKVEGKRSAMAKFFAENPSIRAKLKDFPSTGGATILRNRLKGLLQSDRLSEAERLPALRKLIELRGPGRKTLPSRPRPVGASLIRKCPLENIEKSEKREFYEKRKRAKNKYGIPIVVKAPQGTVGHDIKTVDADSLELVPLDTGRLQVPQLSYGLERVLFNPGVYQLQDPRSRVFNFDPYLQTIMPVSEFDFNALKEYITSSRDKVLLAKAIAENKKYTGSTSSMTSALSHFHFLLSQWREITYSNLSKMFPVEFTNFTAIQRGPVSIFLRWRDGAYAIDADKQFDSGNILMSLGKSMEKLLTLPTKDFEKYRKSNSDQITDEQRNDPEEFHYTGAGDFLLRSQLDAYDSRLPGTGMFDLKTRAVVGVRMDVDAWKDGSGYEIRGHHGEWESFEREYYDMIRSAFLKYSLQVRMGRMDGIFVAYHNTDRIFGFQYISLPEMDFALHGTRDTTLGDQEFKLSLDLLNRALDRATAKYPEQSLKLVIETREGRAPFTYIFAEPFTETAIDNIQNSSKAKIEKFEKAVLGVINKDTSEEDQQKQWDELRAQVEGRVEEDEIGRQALADDDTSGPDSELDNAEEDGELEDNGSDADDVPEEARDLADVITATSLVEEHFSKENGGESSAVEDIEDVENAKDSELEESGDEGEGEDAEAIDAEESVSEPDEDESAETDEGVEAESETSSGDSEVEHSEGASEASDPEDPHSVVDEDSLPISRVLSGKPAFTAKERAKTLAVPREMMAMTLTILNKVNGKYVERPMNLTCADKWEVEHTLSEITDPQRIANLYQMSLDRRDLAFNKDPDTPRTPWNDAYLEKIRNMNNRGRKYRKKQDEADKAQPIKVLDMKDGQKMDEKDHGLWEKKDGQEELERVKEEGG